MIEEYTHKGEGFIAVLKTEGWKIGLLRHSERFASLTGYERHMETDEVFVLLEGKATLYTEEEEKEMKPLTVYNIPAKEWHHIVVSADATVLIAENSDTSAENTQKRSVIPTLGEKIC